MTAHIRIRDIFALALPLGCDDGRLAMLKAYFDDSGTHDSSKVVVVAGIMGTESELESLDAMWKEIIDDPLCGKRPAVKEFHAFDCDNSIGEFLGWKRTETDYFRHQLREAIIKSHVSGYGIAFSRKDWDKIITGDIRDILGDSEGNAIRGCFVRILHWAQWNAFDPDLSFIFDDTEKFERKRDIMSVYDAFKHHVTVNNICGIAFLNSQRVRPLQAADLMAWEFNRYAHDILQNGLETAMTPEMTHLRRGIPWLDGQIAQRERIIQIRDHAKASHAPDVLSQFATHFREFGRAEMGEKKVAKKRKKVEKPS